MRRSGQGRGDSKKRPARARGRTAKTGNGRVVVDAFVERN